MNLRNILLRKTHTHKRVYEILEKAKLICNDRGQISGCLGLGREIDSRGAQVNLLGDGNVFCHDYGGDYVRVYIHQNSSNRTLKKGVFYCMQMSLSEV